MQAKLRKDGDVTVVDLTGRLDFETAEPFRETCQEMLRDSKVVFNLSGLSFVGSSGISAFVNTLKELSDGAPVRPRFCNVRAEFQRVFKSTGQDAFPLFEDERAAVGSFDQPALLNVSKTESVVS
jgi:anti-anti-sigma factor